MPYFFARPSAVLCALPTKHYGKMLYSTQRQAHDIVRQSVERLWHPFILGPHGADLKACRFRENLAEICTPGNTFTCQVNGLPGGRRVLEDFFATLIAGFDIVQVNVESAPFTSLQPRDTRNYSGFYVLRHSRPFMGWMPAPTSLRLPAADPAMGTPPSKGCEAVCNEEGEEVAGYRYPTTAQGESATVKFASSNVLPTLNPSTLVVPFSTYVEAIVGSGRLSHLVLRSPVMELLGCCEGCPEQVRQCLQSKEALNMFSTLCRAGVKPENITTKTLLSASKQHEVWAASLGLF
ncbi:hypothetical protein ABL78_4430 [Leptomonas seymouri]|uniref:Uncharacterized protein n=1 Tax=Leptomonas seymouri TaxID=5684 RepID=A0A0N1HY73_LEPSE|nr:hypothetical protein ABL78_4430 [Leptomonas seymouri]|eukprot:KPI86490.1 hypothetical protein ABL78_4430 [Leptomonas seymouri]